jgi:hypothetical protein
LRTSELALSEDEARELAKAGAAVLAHYNTRATAKTLDWINFIQCAGFIYGSRIMAVKTRKSEEKAARKADAEKQPEHQNGHDPTTTVVHMPADIYGIN